MNTYIMEMIFCMVFWLSLICPLYTYIFYPFILFDVPRKARSYKKGYQCSVLVLIFLPDGMTEKEEIEKLTLCEYPKEKVTFRYIRNSEDTNRHIAHTDCEVIAFLNVKYEYDFAIIGNLVAPFSDPDVGCVIGMQRMMPDQKGQSQEGIFWKYENLVRNQESEIGCVSGANHSVYAVRKALYSKLPGGIKNIGFFVSTAVGQKGADVIFEPLAIAYEKGTDRTKSGFEAHAEEAVCYWQAFVHFRKMLFPGKKGFVYISHRVMKWFVPFNLLMLFISTIILTGKSVVYKLLLIAQIILYTTVSFYPAGKVKSKNAIVKMLDIMHYFLALNVSYVIGLIRFIKRRNKDV